MSKLRFGIVGTGLIADVIANAISKSDNAMLVAVSSRRMETAKKFVEQRKGVEPVEGADNLVSNSEVQAVYVATPTSSKEQIALSALKAGKHLLLDKPFLSYESVKRITDLAASEGLTFMDATHFVHHPRTAIVKKVIADKIGKTKSLHTGFNFPLTDRNNIRFNPSQEPMGAIGDMAWYSMRAVVEYLQPSGKIDKVTIVPEYDRDSGAIARASGVISFDSGHVCTFDAGYTAGAMLMDLQLLGSEGVIDIDDFVLDWANSWAFQSPKSVTGYTFRTGMETRADKKFIATPTDVPQDVLMIDHFSQLVASGNQDQKAKCVEASLRTQEYLDALWTATGAKLPVSARV